MCLEGNTQGIHFEFYVYFLFLYTLLFLFAVFILLFYITVFSVCLMYQKEYITILFEVTVCHKSIPVVSTLYNNNCSRAEVSKLFF